MHRTPPWLTRFPYTTLFRSVAGGEVTRRAVSPGWGTVLSPDGTWLAFSGLETGKVDDHEVRVWEPFGKRPPRSLDRKSTRLNSSHLVISYAVLCLKIKNEET